MEVKIQTIYLTPYAHYDAASAFTREEYLQINERIIEEVLGQTFLLKHIEGKLLALFTRLGKMLKAGKLEIVDR